MGGTPLDDEVKRTVSDVWYKKTAGGKKDVVRKNIISDAKDELRRRNLKVPKSDATFYSIIDGCEHLPEEKRKLLDKLNQPWNLETLSLKDCDLQADTIPFVLQLWRYSVNLGEIFTIRHAKWASRLSNVLNNIDIALKWIHTLRYAIEDELSFLSGTPMKEAQLNSLIVMGQWERRTLEETDVKFKANRRMNNRIFIHYGRDGGIVEEYLHALFDVDQIILDAVLEHKLSENYDRATEIKSLISQLPASSLFFPDFESRMVYLRHLAKLSSLPYWKTAEPKDIYKIICDLRTWIFEAMKDKHEREARPEPNIAKTMEKRKSRFKIPDNEGNNFTKSSDIPTPKPQTITARYGAFPLDIYLQAGFDLTQDTEELEAEFRKVYPDYFKKSGGNE